MQSMQDRFDYGTNPEKTLDGALIRAYECDPMTADAEFLLAKEKYKAITGREQKRDADVLCYQIRQSFPPGELSHEAALEVGYELAMRWTKGKHAFFVVSHADRSHPHVHIYYNSTSLDCTRKYRDFLGSARALRRLSDRICIEHDLSVITAPKLHSQGKYPHYGAWLGDRRLPSQKERLRQIIDAVLAEGPADLNDFLRRMEAAGAIVLHGRSGAISFRLSVHERPARWRSASLGEGYGPEDIRAVIAGERPAPKGASSPARVSLIIDIQKRLAEGKGPGYERWAKIYNLKQMAAALQYLQEHGLTDYDALAASTDTVTERFHDVSERLRRTEDELSRTSDLIGAVVQYARTRPVFDGYKAAKYSKKYFAEHAEAIADYRAATAQMRALLDGEKLPKMDMLKEKRRRLTTEKKALYEEYRRAQRAMREAVTVKTNIDHLLGVTGGKRNKEQER